MLHALFSAPGTMAKHANLAITAIVLVFIQQALFQLTQGYLGFIQDTGTLDLTTILSNPLPFLVGGIVFVLNVSVSLYLFALVANAIRGNASTGNKPASATFGNSLTVGFFLAVIFLGLFAGGIFFLEILAGFGGIVGFILTLLFFLGFLFVFGMIIAFSFFPSLMGVGFVFKDALAQSWQFTTKHIFLAIVFLLGIMIIATLIQGISDIGTSTLTNEWIVLVISSLFGGIASFYTATAFANAIPNEYITKSGTSIARHAHKK